MTGRIDSATIPISEFVLPEKARPWRIAVTPDDMNRYSDYNRVYVARLSRADGSV